MNTKTTEDTGARQPRPVLYEPQHTDKVTEQIRLALGLRGYTLTRDEADMPEDLAVPWAMVTEGPNGALCLEDGETGIGLPPVEAYSTPAAYAGAIASWLDSGDDDALDPTERDPEMDERVDIDAVRSGAVDLADMPSVLESLCDEVEALRAEVASLHEDGAR